MLRMDIGKAYLIIPLFLSITIFLARPSIFSTAASVTGRGELKDKSFDVQIERFMVFTKIKYRYSKTIIFCEMNNPHPTLSQESIFALTLPEDALISNFSMEIDGRIHQSSVQDGSRANQIYDKAKRTGVTSATIANEETNKFQVAVHIRANSTILFLLEYEEEIAKCHGLSHYYEYSLSLIPQLQNVKHFCVDVEIEEFKPFKITSVNLCNKKGQCVEMDFKKDATIIQPESEKSKTRIIWEPSKNETLRLLQELRVVGQFKLHYQFNENTPVNDIVIRNGYVVHRFDVRNSSRKVPLHVIFVLDYSGSMIGSRGDNMKRAMRKILRDLKDYDFFHLITFSTTAKNWKPMLPHGRWDRLYPSDFYFKQMAMAEINTTEFQGSTNIHEALMEALKTANMTTSLHRSFCEEFSGWETKHVTCKEGATQISPMIFFLTDGYPTSGLINKTSILRRIKENNPMRIPIFSVALGPSSDYVLLQILSAQNYGLARLIYGAADIEHQLDEFYKFVSSPVLKDSEFFYANPLNFSKLASSVENHRWLSSKEEVTVIGKIDIDINRRVNWISHLKEHGLQQENYTTATLGNPRNELMFKARVCPCGICSTKGRNKSEDTFLAFKRDGPLCLRTEEDNFLERFWVHRTVNSLIQEALTTGNESTIQRIINLSKKYHLVTPYTSLLIQPTISRSSNAVYYSQQLIPQIFARYTGSEHGSFHNGEINAEEVLGQSETSHIRFFSPSAGRRRIHQPPKLQFSFHSYLGSLLHEQRTSLTQAAQNLSLEYLQWPKRGNDTLLQLLDKNEQMHTFTILTSSQLEPEFRGQLCHVSRFGIKVPGRCVHLARCIEKEYISDIRLYVQNYFCPITQGNLKFAGTCCTRLQETIR